MLISLNRRRWMENEMLIKVPPIVSIEFNETIQSSGFNSLIVVDASGKRVDLKNDLFNHWIGHFFVRCSRYIHFLERKSANIDLAL